MRKSSRVGLWLSLWLLVPAACHHAISFYEIGYVIHSDLHDESLIVVIDPVTLDQTVSIRSFMTGIAHRWDAKPGLMLKQIADVEFPQMFEHYRVAAAYDEMGPAKNH